MVMNHVSRTLLYSYLKKGYPDPETICLCSSVADVAYTGDIAAYGPCIRPVYTWNRSSSPQVYVFGSGDRSSRSSPFQCPLQRFLGDSTPIPRTSVVCFLVL
jgi:hypothetical protein